MYTQFLYFPSELFHKGRCDEQESKYIAEMQFDQQNKVAQAIF